MIYQKNSQFCPTNLLYKFLLKFDWLTKDLHIVVYLQLLPFPWCLTSIFLQVSLSTKLLLEHYSDNLCLLFLILLLCSHHALRLPNFLFTDISSHLAEKILKVKGSCISISVFPSPFRHSTINRTISIYEKHRDSRFREIALYKEL